MFGTSGVRALVKGFDSIAKQQASVWRQGFSAFEIGSKCPYNFGSWQHSQWLAGYTEASEPSF